MKIAVTTIAVLFLALLVPSHAAVDTRGIDWEQRLHAQIPLDLPFTDAQNRNVHLRDYFGRGPVVLVFVYFSCPKLCPEVLAGVKETLQRSQLTPGRDYRVVAVSIDQHDTARDARAQAEHLIAPAGFRSALSILSSSTDSAARLARAVGFHYKYDPEQQQFAHPAGFVIATPRGEVSRYFPGVRYDESAVHSALLAAGKGDIGTLAQRLLLLCYHFDASSGRYSLAVMNMLRMFGIACLSIAALLLWRHRRGGRTS
jgi:protein SCO1/2